MPENIRKEARIIEAQPTLKALDEAGRIGGYLVVWGSPRQRDVQGEYFTQETELGLDWYDRRPVLYHHGQDAALKSALVGVLDTLQADEIGLWAEAQLERRLRYFQALTELVKRGVLGWSSGSLPQLREVASDGRILRWPIVEGSLTPTPAEPRHTEIQSLKSAYAALGLDSARWLGSAGIPSETKAKGIANMNPNFPNRRQRPCGRGRPRNLLPTPGSEPVCRRTGPALTGAGPQAPAAHRQRQRAARRQPV